MNKLRILIADDHAIVRFGLVSLFAEQDDMDVVGEARNGEEAVALARRLRPDIVVMDLMMPRMDGAQATAEILRDLPTAKIVLLTSYGAYDGTRCAIRNGAVAAITKTTEDEMLVPIIRRVARGETYYSQEIKEALDTELGRQGLTDRQSSLLDAVARGLSNSEIAALFGIGTETARDQLSALFRKLGAANRTEAVAIAFRNRLLKV